MYDVFASEDIHLSLTQEPAAKALLTYYYQDKDPYPYHVGWDINFKERTFEKIVMIPGDDPYRELTGYIGDLPDLVKKFFTVNWGTEFPEPKGELASLYVNLI